MRRRHWCVDGKAGGSSLYFASGREKTAVSFRVISLHYQSQILECEELALLPNAGRGKAAVPFRVLSLHYQSQTLECEMLAWLANALEIAKVRCLEPRIARPRINEGPPKSL